MSKCRGETLEQLLHQEVQQLVVVGGTALGQKVVQAVVSQIGHGEQVGVVHPLNGVQGAQLGLEQGQQHQHGGENHRRQGEQGGIVKAEGAIYACKVMPVCPKCGKATRVAHAAKDGKNVRVCRKCGAEL